MNFKMYLTEETASFVKVESEQLSIIKQEIDRNAVRESLEKEYIQKADKATKMIDNDYYISDIALTDGDEVLIKASIIVEVTEDDGYIYYKPVEFIFNMDKNELVSASDNDRIRDENWKNVQQFVLRSAKKV